ncbi:methyl-CpG-binding domain protein 5-like isoform X2 [Clupea harengus]|uniref:Methyl-CpG-binding domain protein 5-like isoform X2 n=1 Tax=Clupea harengus TaxID=7950 RepID=A0A6P8GRW3_CLUHA|nr:methyl-CpG-binding domain protein 5-like isoform X2 [Clupea harengus]
MNTMKTIEVPDTQRLPSATQVPIGWQRKGDHTRVVYISPSGSVLACLEQVKSYLLTDGTCKCGLECPLILSKVFNFDPGAAVRQRTTEDARADEDVTRLCIHKRKIIAVATLHKSMMSPNPSLVLTSPSGDTSLASFTRSLSHPQRDGSTRSLPEDSNRPYRTPLTTHGHMHFRHDMGSPPQQDVYSNYSRTKQGSSEHVDRKSPYRHRLSALLSPNRAAGSHPYLDGGPSSRSDSLMSPDRSAGFQGTCSPGKTHANRAPTTPLSPLHASHLSSLPSSQPSCAMAGRITVPPSPSSAAKSPVMKPRSCSFPQNMDMFHHKPHSVLHRNSHHPQLSPCVLAKQQVNPETDPLGILDPIPSHSSLGLNPSSLQTSAHSQVPQMNVNMHSTTVPLPSNLPLPTARSGPTSNGSRGQHHAPLSISPSPIASPVQMAASSLVRLDTQHLSTHSASSVSDHGDFVLPTGPQASFGLSKGLSQSPQSSLGSPYPVMPSSPTAKSEMLQNYKDHSNHFLGGMNSTLRKHSDPKYAGFGSGDGLQKSNQALMGMNHILNKRNPTTFPASILLSAAAKAQTANTNVCAGGESEAGVPGGHHSMNAIANPHPPAVSEAQSGRAALRDKLMAQQRDAFHKNRHLSNSNNTAFNMPESQFGGSGSRFLGSSEFVRKLPQQPGFKGSTSMAQLLQNMSGTHNGTSQMGHYVGGSAQSPFRDGMISIGTPFQSQQVVLRSQDGMDLSQYQNMEQHGMNEDRPSAMMNHYQPQSHAELSWMGQSGQAAMGSQGPHKPHQQQLSHHYYPLNTPHVHNRPAFSSMIPNGYAQTLSGAPHK